MSIQAIEWVLQNSPYSGENRLIHVIIANVVNDSYGNRFWLAEEKLAAKANCSTRTVRRAKAQMVNDCFLEIVDSRHGPGKTNEYHFLMPSVLAQLEATEDKVSGVEERTEDKVSGEHRTSATQHRTNATSSLLVNLREHKLTQELTQLNAEGGKREESKTPSKATDEKPSENSSNANTSRKTASGEATKTRKRDLFFDAMAEANGHDLTQLTKTSASMIATATNIIRPVCKSPDEIWVKAAIYKKLHPDWSLTPSSLAKYWSSLTQEQVDNQGSDKYRAHKDFEDEIFGRKPQDPTSRFRIVPSVAIEAAATDAKVSATPLQRSAPEPVAALSPPGRNDNQVSGKHQGDKDAVAEIPEQLPQGDVAAVQTAAGAPIGSGTTEDGGFPTSPQRSAPERPTAPSQSERTFDDEADNYEDYDSHADDNFEDYEDRYTYDSDASGDGCDWGGDNA